LGVASVSCPAFPITLLIDPGLSRSDSVLMGQKWASQSIMIERCSDPSTLRFAGCRFWPFQAQKWYPSVP
jgi:hypothetical protein